MQNLHMSLGCFGLTIDNFIFCAGTENKILDIKTSLPNYNQLMDYLDQFHLFDRPCFDTNAIKHLIFNLQDRYSFVTRPLWSNANFELYQKFLIGHKNCGVFVKLSTATAVISEQPEQIFKKSFQPITK